MLRAYEQWGIECIIRFRGMFACAIYDSSSSQLYLIRDRVGIKPLYYCRQGDQFAFASELSALLELRWLRRDVDAGALASLFPLRERADSGNHLRRNLQARARLLSKGRYSGSGGGETEILGA